MESDFKHLYPGSKLLKVGHVYASLKIRLCFFICNMGMAIFLIRGCENRALFEGFIMMPKTGKQAFSKC